MKSLPALIGTSMLICNFSVPLGCVLASFSAPLFYAGRVGAETIPVLWVGSTIIGFPLALFYGAPLYALCLRYYRPAWWVVLLIGGGPFLPFAVGDLADGSIGDGLLLQIFGVSVAVVHHVLMTGLTGSAGAAGADTAQPRTPPA